MAPDENVLIRRIQELNAPLNAVAADIHPRLERLPGLRAVLCDVYGTLLVSNAGASTNAHPPDRAAAFRAALQALNCKVDAPTAERGVDLFNAVLASARADRQASGIEHTEVDVRTIWTKVLNELRRRSAIKLDSNESLTARVAIEYENRINPVWPMPDVASVISRLATDGWVLGIVSNAQFYTPLTLTALFGKKWKSWFAPSLCFWSYEHDEAKPGPNLYRRAATALKELHGISPAQVVMIGNDVAHDITPAQACGFRAILFAGDRRACRVGNASQRQVASWPWLTITHWPQIMDVIGKQ